MRTFVVAAVSLMMASGVAFAQTPSTTGHPEGYSNSGAYKSSNGAPVAGNGGLQSGVGTTLVSPQAGSGRSTPLGSNSGGGGGAGGTGSSSGSK